MSGLPVIQALTPHEVHARAMARGADCPRCPLFGCGRGPVLSEIRPNSYVTLVGEAPRPNDVIQGAPFVGWSGEQVEAALNSGGLSREHVSLLNTILCQPPDGGNFRQFVERLLTPHRRLEKAYERRKKEHNKAAKARKKAGLPPLPSFDEPAPVPPTLPQEACFPRLLRDLQEANSKVLLAVGKQALESLAKTVGASMGAKNVDDVYIANIKNQHGAPVHLPDGRILTASFHPAMTAPGRGKHEYRHVVHDDIARAASIAIRGGTAWREPEYLLNLTPDQIINVLQHYRANGAEVTADIETDGVVTQECTLRCIGVGAHIGGQEVVMVAPTAHMDGTPWWPQHEYEKLRRAFAEVFDRQPLAGQNFGFDTNVLLRLGFMSDRAKAWTDVMMLHHDTHENDLPHDLGFIARRFFDAPVWKGIDHKSVDNIKDAELHEYNAKDVLITMRLLAPLRSWVGQLGTLAQYQTDTALGPVLRDMGDLGLVVDEARRGEFSELFNQKCFELTNSFRELTECPTINPRSTMQLRDLLFGSKQEGGWAYQPTLDTSGDEWEDGDDPSTSTPALIELKKHGMDPEHVKAIDTLFDLRAFDKLRGTYIDNAKVRHIDWSKLGIHGVGRVGQVLAPDWDEETGKEIQRVALEERSALGLLNPTFRGHIVPTGRLSSNPNVQNWPALGKANVRDMVIAPPGHVIVGADWAQLEGRLYAIAAQDAMLLETITGNPPKDLHSMNAATLLARNMDEVEYWYRNIEEGEGIDPSKREKHRKYWRTVAKRFAFLCIYGGEKAELFSVMAAQRNKATGKLDFPDLTPDDVDRWYDNWHTMHPETMRWHDECRAFEAAHGYSAVPILDQRRRYFPGGPSRKNAVANMRIQGFAGSLANRALLLINEAIPHRGWSPLSGLFLQVHDYLAVIAPESRAEEAKEIIESCMFYEHAGVPLPADAMVSRRWSQQG